MTITELGGGWWSAEAVGNNEPMITVQPVGSPAPASGLDLRHDVICWLVPNAGNVRIMRLSDSKIFATRNPQTTDTGLCAVPCMTGFQIQINTNGGAFLFRLTPG
jgi:hypothetical protein